MSITRFSSRPPGSWLVLLCLALYGFDGCKEADPPVAYGHGDVVSEAPFEGSGMDAGGLGSDQDGQGDSADGATTDPSGGETPAADAATKMDASTDDGFGKVCGTIAGLTCPSGQYCDLLAGDGCGIPDAAGLCAPVPQLCEQQYEPVCGCDGTTFGNRCAAAALGVSVAREGRCSDAEDGECECSGPAPKAPTTMCDDGSVAGPFCQLAGGECSWTIRTCPPADPEDAGPGQGHDAAKDAGAAEEEDPTCGGPDALTCPDGQVCEYAADEACGRDDATGICRAVPDSCDGATDPICGCDGKTYDSPCKAARGGTPIAHEGPCEPEPCDENTCAGTPSRAPNVMCGDGSIGGPVCKRNEKDVCKWTLRTCPDNDVRCGGIAGFPCPSDDEYCDLAAGDGCDVSDAMGVCKPRPSACDLIISPVCGCDGRNYTSACEAATKGVTVKRSGICF